MPKFAKTLTVKDCDAYKGPGYKVVGGVDGLRLQVIGNSRSWLLMYPDGVTATGKPRRREYGLGPCRDVSLAQAREKARALREKLKVGITPQDEQEAQKQEQLAKAARKMTFRIAAERFLEAKSGEWSNETHRQQWRSTLETYAYPVLGEMAVNEIEIEHVHAALVPIWTRITVTATRVRERIQKVLEWATTMKFRTGPNPAIWSGNLEILLPSPGQIRAEKHHPALPYDQIAGFVATLRTRNATTARMLEFTILTAARTGEVLNATWDEIDFGRKMWIVPAARMKAGKEHRVPLSTSALRLLQRTPTLQRRGLLFRNEETGQAFSNMAMLQLIKKMHKASIAREEPGYLDRISKTVVTPHGFRSTFRDWTAEENAYEHDMCEMALAHTVADDVEAAYRRGDLLRKRFAMMEDWASYCEGASN